MMVTATASIVSTILHYTQPNEMVMGNTFTTGIRIVSFGPALWEHLFAIHKECISSANRRTKNVIGFVMAVLFFCFTFDSFPRTEGAMLWWWLCQCGWWWWWWDDDDDGGGGCRTNVKYITYSMNVLEAYEEFQLVFSVDLQDKKKTQRNTETIAIDRMK